MSASASGAGTARESISRLLVRGSSSPYPQGRRGGEADQAAAAAGYTGTLEGASDQRGESPIGLSAKRGASRTGADEAPGLLSPPTL